MKRRRKIGVYRGLRLRRRLQPTPWARLRDKELLAWRIRDLKLQIAGTVLEERVVRLYAELGRRGIVLRPHVWLSHEWFTPDGVPGFAIPFYLAHPRLMKLEQRQMLEAEGGSERWCMQILRHEAGHAVSNAYRLHRRKDWRDVFGPSSTRYPAFYRPRPYSKKFVLHLDYWYAQAHPAEDFAETFAVWLTPSSQWRKRYEGWPALKKLEYVDRLMTEIAGVKPRVLKRNVYDPVRSLSTTLGEHYRRKRLHYGEDHPAFYENDLRRLFSDAPQHREREAAAAFLRRIRPQLRELVARWTGQHVYTIDQVLRQMIVRARQLKLRLDRPERQATMEAGILLSVQTMNYLHSGRHRVFL